MKYAGSDAVEVIKKRRIHKEKKGATEPSSCAFTATFPLTRVTCTSTKPEATTNGLAINYLTGASTMEGDYLDNVITNTGSTTTGGGVFYYYNATPANGYRYGVVIGRLLLSSASGDYFADTPSTYPMECYMSGIGHIPDLGLTRYGYKVYSGGINTSVILYSWAWST